MQRLIVFTLGLVMAAAAAQVQAQIGVGVDCDAQPCSRTKYGLDGMDIASMNRFLPKLANNIEDLDPFATDASAFGPDIGGSSYIVTLAPGSGFLAPCGKPNDWSVVPGQIILEEQTDCVPVSFGPDDAANGGVAGGCRVSIPLSDGGKGTIDAVGTAGTCQDFGGACTSDADCRTGGNETDICQWDLENVSELLIPSRASGVIAGSSFSLTAATGNTIGGGSIEGLHDEACDPDIVKAEPQSGTRYLLPNTHPDFAELNADGEAPTYLRWDNHPDTRWRIHTDDTAICCTSAPGDVCGLLAVGTPEYPDLLKRTCADGQIFQDTNETNDWIFDDGQGSAFYSDPHYVPTDVEQGRCEEQGAVSCTVSGTECAATYCEASFDLVRAVPCASTADCAAFSDLGLSDACVAPGGACDFREIAHRIRPPALSNGDPNTTVCAASGYVFRGTPNVGCSINPRYTVNGDPGPTCEVLNFGVNTRKDQDCDGVIDNPDDLCPFVTDFDETADTDGDCPGPLCRGDECECGDSTLSGTVDVADILFTNASIFDIEPGRTLCDATGDAGCDVGDILAANLEIFVPGSSTCRQVQPLPVAP